MSIREKYNLSLTQGCAWEITGSRGAEAWILKLAEIMQLPRARSNGLPQLLITRQRQGARELKRKGWKLTDHKVLRLWLHEDAADVIVELSGKRDYTLEVVRMMHLFYPVYQKVVGLGGFSLHAGLVAREGQGVILAAPGGRGKSTCCARIPKPWQSLCDDETLVVKNKSGGYRAHPFPTWSEHLDQPSDRSWNTKKSVSLAAIFFLEQAERDEVAPIGQGEAVILINQSADQVCRRVIRRLKPAEEKAFKHRLFENACALARAVPAYILKVSLTGKFWKKIEKVL